MENVKILSPAAFQSIVCGNSGEVAAGTDHAQDIVSVHQQPGMNPQNESSKPCSFKKIGEPRPACSEFSAVNIENTGNAHRPLILATESTF